MNKFLAIVRILIVLSVFVLPWWGVAILAFIALLRLDFFLEIVLIGFLLDITYGTHLIFEDFPYGITLIALLVFLASIPFKKRLL